MSDDTIRAPRFLSAPDPVELGARDLFDEDRIALGELTEDERDSRGRYGERLRTHPQRLRTLRIVAGDWARDP